MRLFCDCKTDEEKSNFFLSGMAVETGIIAPAISNDVAMAYHRCAQFKKENDELRAKIEQMEQQEPVAWCATDESGTIVEAIGMNQSRRFDTPLYLAPGAQPAPSEKDEPIRKAWARFSNELHRSPDAPYPGMADAFERHFSQSFTDREWRAESATWAAAWKAAKRHEAQAQPAPSIPEGWKSIPEKHPTFDLVDLRLADGSVLCECVPQSDGDYWWNGPSGEVFIDPKYAPVTHWRLAAAPEAKP